MADEKMTASEKKAARRAVAKELNSGEDNKIWYAVVFFAVLFGIGAIQFVNLLLGGGLDVAAGAGGMYLPKVDVQNEVKATEVFLSGYPAAVWCQGEKTYGGPVPPIILEVQQKLASMKDTQNVKVYAANCFEEMKWADLIADPYSGDITKRPSLMEKFSFGKNESFMAVFANQDPPQMLNHFGNAKNVAKQIKEMVKTEVTDVILLKHFERCQDRKSCLIVGGEKGPQLKSSTNLFKPLVTEFRGVSVMSVDTKFWMINVVDDNEDKLPKKDEADQEYGVAACVVKRSEKGEDLHEIKTWTTAFLEDWSEAGVRKFIASCQEGGADLDMSAGSKKKPEVKARPSPTTTPSPAKFDKKERVGKRKEETEDADEDLDAEEELPPGPGDEEEEIEDEEETEL